MIFNIYVECGGKDMRIWVEGGFGEGRVAGWKNGVVEEGVRVGDDRSGVSDLVMGLGSVVRVELGGWY